MQTVRVEDAVGMVLAHDLTEIIPGVSKGAAFKKGHIVHTEDVEHLKRMGKYHIRIFTLDEQTLHEEEAARRIACAVMGEGLRRTAPLEGRVNIQSTARGLLEVNTDALAAINAVDDVILATLHRYTLVEKDALVAGTKVVPLVVPKERIEAVERIARAHAPVLSVHPLFPLKVGIVVTGTEVYEGRIQDKFAPVLRGKVEEMGGQVLDVAFAPDDLDTIRARMQTFLDVGAELVMVSGGMAVDADDLTPTAIRQIAPDVVTYGSPVLPGAMFMLAYAGEIPVVGVPACGMFRKRTVLDLLLPRLFAKRKLCKHDITALAHGGLCLNCPECHYPVCPFGKV